MRLRPIAALSTVAVSMLLLAGCAGGSEPEATETSDLCAAIAAPGEASESVTIDGEPGTASTLTFTGPLEVPEVQVSVVAEGDGDPVESGDFISYAFSAYDAATAEQIITIGYEDGELMPSQMSAESPLGQMLGCAAPGQRVVAALPASETAEAEVYIIDVLDVVPTAAWGEPQAPVDGMPEVTVADDGTPSVTVGDAETPAETEVVAIKQADGYTVQDGDYVLIQYHGVRLSNGEEFDSTWTNGGVPVAYPTTTFVEGFQKALVGQTVGSQVLAVIPPAEGYGEGEINEEDLVGDTLVFVVDILGAQHVEATPAE